MFPSRSNQGRDRFTYKRFDTAAEALRFAVEDMSAPALLGACLESEETRCGAQEIRRLYESAAFPLERRTAVATNNFLQNAFGSSNLMKARRRHAKVEEMVINSVQISFVSKRMLVDRRRKPFDHRLRKRKVPFCPQLR